MALRDQPYLPLYVQDIMTDEKLNECSAATHGIYIKGLMCLMHKSEEYGKILLKQKYKQTSKQDVSMSLKFALQLTKHLPYSIDEIKNAIEELIHEEVCYFDGDYLCQKRMIRDNEISEARSLAGKKGGGNPKFVKTKLQTNTQTNTEYEYEYENINITSSNEKIGVTEERKTKPEKPGWRTDFEIYQEECTQAYIQLINDPDFIAERQKYHPRVNIQLTIEKSFKDFWSTEAGWKNKKATKSKQIDWKRTFINAIDQKFNHVYADNSQLPRAADNRQTAPESYKRNSTKNNRAELESLRDLSIAVLQSDVPNGMH